MTWFDLSSGRGVLELDDETELMLWWGDGRTRAALLDSQTGALLAWVAVGNA